MSTARRSRSWLGVRVVGPSVHVPWFLLVLGWLLGRLGRGLWWLARHPFAAVGLAVVVGLWWLAQRYGVLAGAGVLGVLLMAAGGWGYARPAAATGVLRSRWRRLWVYRRWWEPAMASAGLTGVGGEVPAPGRVRSTPGLDVVRVRMLPGQTVADWASAGPRLAQTFGVRSCRARTVPGSVHDVELRCTVGDALKVPVDVPAPATVKHLRAVPVGRGEDGRIVTLPVLHSHILIGGETGAGKGSVLWSLIAGMGPAIRDGLVRVWALDPKGGMELAFGAPLFDRFEYGPPAEMAEFLEAAVSAMRARALRLRGQTRELQPTYNDPLIVILIDELSSFTAYVSDVALRRRLINALSLLLSQGRAVGVTVIAATQDVRTETVGFRLLFRVRVALRASEPEQADMLLGDGARKLGALTDQISPSTPGVGYVVEEGSPEPRRVRFAHVTDDRIAHVVQQFRPGTEVR